jgi:hypothetical protein
VSERSHWWVTRDVRRLIARADFTNGKVTSDAELRYLRTTAEVLLHGPLPLVEGDREWVERIHHELRRTLAERAAERIETP